MALSTLKKSQSAATARKKEYDDGFAFRFKFPGERVLIAADIIDGVPKLRFAHSLNVSSIVEEDIAVCARLSREKIRPEFVYIAFPPGHPFYGRQYKDYRPSYLRGTSIGELLAEADWKMKCLWAGVKSDETKTKFMSWADNSQLDGLSSFESFSASAPNGSIFMRCKSVEVCESEEEILFCDPKMSITGSHSNSFSKYLTALFDAIAFYDEPLFSKVKEVIKLILAMEWFEKKGVKFSMEWINEHLERSRMSPRQVVAVKSPKMSNEIVGHVLKQLQLRETATPMQSVLAIQLPLPWSASILPAIRTTTSITATATESTFQIKHVSKIGFPAVVSRETTLTISMDDVDTLYEGEDPNSPVGYLDKNGKPNLIIPNVKSWSELLAETVPFPCKAVVNSDGECANIANGGVSALSIPVANIAKAAVPVIPAAVTAVASFGRGLQTCKRSELKIPQMVSRPSTDAACLKHNRPLSSGSVQPVFGYRAGNTHIKFGSNGKVAAQQKEALYSINKKLSVNGHQITATSRGSIPLPSAVVEKAEYPDYYDGVKEVHGNNTVNVPPQQDNLTLQLPQLEQPAITDKMSPTCSVDSGMYDCNMPQQDPLTGQLVDDVLSPTDTIDSGLGLHQTVASTC